MKPRIGPKMKKALEFAQTYTENGGWFSFNSERGTREPIARLEKLGLVETNQFGMFRVPPPAGNDIRHTFDNDGRTPR